MKKKIIYSLIGGASLLMPVAAVVSCGSSNSNHKSEHVYEDGVVVSTSPKKIEDSFGEGNLADPALTRKIAQGNLMEYKTRKATGQPFVLHYHMRDVAKWETGKDSDDAFNVATIPLKDRALAGKILASQKDKQLQILSALQKNVNDTPTGTVDKLEKDDRVFYEWSKVTSFVSWGGAADAGVVCVPKGNDINAAHRNGVPLIGTVFFPPNVFGGSISLYEELSQKNSDGTFPVADNLVAMASHFGFDGWFLNFESGINGTDLDAPLKARMGEFLKYFHDKMEASKLFTVLYDFGQGQSFMRDKDNYNFDMAAIDFQHRSMDYDSAMQSKLADKSNPDIDKVRGLYDLPADIRTLGYNYDTGSDLAAATDEGGVFDYHGSNLWLYSYFNRHDITDGDETDLKLFDESEGVSRDPRAKSTTKWTGLSQYFQAHTPLVSRDKFSSSFELGVGSKYYIDGKEQPLGSALSENGFRNSGIQDVLPTYTWINDEYSSATEFSDTTLTSTPGDVIDDGSGTPWEVKLDESGTPYYGSTNLHYTGKIKAGSTVVSRLYGSQIPLKENDEFSVVAQGSDTNPDLALWYQDKLDTNAIVNHVSKVIKPTGEKVDLGNDLFRFTYKIPKELESKVMISFGLSFSNSGTKAMDVDDHIGQISYTPVETIGKTIDDKMVKLTQDGNFLFQGKRNARINWTMDDASKVDHYVIWSTKQTNDDDFDKDEILNVTTLPAAYLQDIAKKSNVNIVIDAMDDNDEIISSNKAVVKTSFKPMTDKSKWTEEFSRADNADAVWTVNTGNGYSATFKDSDGNLYIGDNYTRIHKISTDGTLRTAGTDEWGTQVIAAGKDMNTLKIWEWDADNIAVLTADGHINILDKTTGEKSQNEITTVSDYIEKLKQESIAKIKANPQYIALANDKKAGVLDGNMVKSLDEVKFISDDSGVVTLIGTTNMGDEISVTINNGKATEIPNQTGDKKVSVDLVNKDTDGKIEVAYKQGDNIGLATFDSVNDIDFSKLTANSTIIDKMKEYVNSDDFKSGFDASFLVGSNLDDLTKGKIVYTKELANGDVLVVNSWGIAMTLDKDGSVKGITSTISKDTWVSYATAQHGLFQQPGFNNPGWYKVKDSGITLQTALDATDGLVAGQVEYDETGKTLRYVEKTARTFRWWGYASAIENIVISDLSKLDSGTPVTFAPVAKRIVLADKAPKDIGEIVFIENIGGVTVMGGLGSSVGVYDKDFNMLPIGHKVYSYSGSVIESVIKIYDDKDASIPKIFMV